MASIGGCAAAIGQRITEDGQPGETILMQSLPENSSLLEPILLRGCRRGMGNRWAFSWKRRSTSRRCAFREAVLALLSSDGLTEPLNPEGREFGLAAVKQNLGVHRQESANEICADLWNAVQAHSDEKPHQDDFTTVVIKRN